VSRPDPAGFGPGRFGPIRLATVLLATVPLATVLAACGSEQEILVSTTASANAATPTETTTPTATPTATPTPTETGPGTTVPDTESTTSSPTGTESTEFASTLGEPLDLSDFADSEPVDLAVRPGTSPTSFLVLRGGQVIRLADDLTPDEVVLDISDEVRAEGERGLLGLAFDGDGSRAFVNHTGLDGDTRIVVYGVDEDGTFDESTAVEVYRLPQPYANHNGGEILVDVARDRLLVPTGDGGSANDPDRVALDPASPLGKILALPLLADGTVGTPEIVAVGLRNPWRAVIDGDDLWIADVGQGEWEEVNVVALDRLDAATRPSFGWSAFEGTHPFNDDQAAIHAGLTAVEPITEYQHVGGRCSISGGAVAANTGDSTWYVFADFCSGEVAARCLIGCEPATIADVAVGTVPEAVAVLPDHRGRLWVLGLDGLLVPILSDR